MGSASTKVWGRREPEIQFMESTKAPTAKDMDTRKRNSLMFFMRDWQELTTFEQQEASMVQVRYPRVLNREYLTIEQEKKLLSAQCTSSLVIMK